MAFSSSTARDFFLEKTLLNRRLFGEGEGNLKIAWQPRTGTPVACYQIVALETGKGEAKYWPKACEFGTGEAIFPFLTWKTKKKNLFLH